MVSLELIRLQLKSYAFSFDGKVMRLVIFMEKCRTRDMRRDILCDFILVHFIRCLGPRLILIRSQYLLNKNLVKISPPRDTR